MSRSPGGATTDPDGSVALRFVRGTLVTPTGPVAGDLVVRDGRITQVGGVEATSHTGVPVRRDADEVVVDVDGLLVAPGFLDLQVNGGHGIDLTSELTAQPTRLFELGRRLPAQGVTAFLPTIVSAPPGCVDAAVAALDTAPPGYLGAAALGVHAEGPMLAPAKRGTHDPRYLRAPAPSVIDGWSRDTGVVMVTVAPELPGALAVIRELTARGVVVSIGHTAASYEATIAAIDAGARGGTHLFNAMAAWTARDPGPVAALLADPRPVLGLIVDGIHLHPGTVAAVWRAVGPDRVVLVTDAVALAGSEEGSAVLGGRRVAVTDGVVRDEDGALAGSVLTLDRALRALVAATGTDPWLALRTVTAIPAALLGVEDRGALRPGARGDLVVLTPDLEVVATFVGGSLAALPRPDRLPRPPDRPLLLPDPDRFPPDAP